jgi:hypothetical protein
MHRLGSFKKHQEQQVEETPQERTASQDSQDSGNWIGRPVDDEDSDLEAGEDEEDDVKDETESQEPAVDTAQARPKERVPSDDSSHPDNDERQQTLTPLSQEEEEAVNMPGSFHLNHRPHQNDEINEGLLSRIRMMFGSGT